MKREGRGLNEPRGPRLPMSFGAAAAAAAAVVPIFDCIAAAAAAEEGGGGGERRQRDLDLSQSQSSLAQSGTVAALPNITPPPPPRRRAAVT